MSGNVTDHLLFAFLQHGSATAAATLVHGDTRESWSLRGGRRGLGAAGLVLALSEWRQLGVVWGQHGGVRGVGLQSAVVARRVSLALQALDVFLPNTQTSSTINSPLQDNDIC